jgi:TRAP-type C4-dicarboxylate transport system permease small subunit
MTAILGLLSRLDRWLLAVLEVICIALFAAITFILTLNIVVRFFPVMSMHWFDEILEMLYGALIFYGACAVWVAHEHFSVGDWLSKYLPGTRSRLLYRFLVEACSLVFIAVFFWFSLQLTLETSEHTTAFAIPKAWLYACMPITGAIMLAYSLKNMVLELRAVVLAE